MKQCFTGASADTIPPWQAGQGPIPRRWALLPTGPEGPGAVAFQFEGQVPHGPTELTEVPIRFLSIISHGAAPERS